MRKAKYILSGLLVAMLFFAVHDYMLTQVNKADGMEKQKTLVKVEHSVFHTPIILTALDTNLQVEFEEKTIYFLKNFTVTNFKNSLFKPPRNS